MLLATLIGVAIVDVIRRPDLGGGAKVAWSLFIFIVPLIGAIVYLIVRPAQPSDRFAPSETEEGVEPWRHGPA